MKATKLPRDLRQSLWLDDVTRDLLDDVVIGGGNAKQPSRLPMRRRVGDDADAFRGGLRHWEDA